MWLLIMVELSGSQSKKGCECGKRTCKEEWGVDRGREDMRGGGHKSNENAFYAWVKLSTNVTEFKRETTTPL